ncbi:MAG TPA: VOC family protein [Thermoanaerobaculia bacterium]|nr:VOC family protein [Thermoanaerobaculia bacterium]
MAFSDSRKPARPTLGGGDAVATIAVKDVRTSRKFYENTLGLAVEDVQGSDVVTYRSGDSRLFVYQSPFAGTNQATCVTWTSRDVDSVAAGLKARGVSFEHYDFPNTTHVGDVHVSGEMRVAWFKDPDGNILSIVNG